MHCFAVTLILLVSVFIFYSSTAAVLRRQSADIRGFNNLLTRTNNPQVDEHEKPLAGKDIKTSVHMATSTNNKKTKENGELNEKYSLLEKGNHWYRSDSVKNRVSKNTRQRKSKKESRTLEDDMETRFKKLLGTEDFASPSERQLKKYKPSRYIQDLFSAMLSDDYQRGHATVPGTEMVVPTIESYRSTKVKSRNRQGQIVSYDIGETSVKFSRVEVVIAQRLWNANKTTYFLALTSEINGDVVEIPAIQANVHGDYLIFDITDISEYLNGSFRLFLRLSMSGEYLRISKRNSPLLVLYENMDFNPLLKRASRQKRDAEDYRHYLVDDVSSMDDYDFEGFNCKRYDWVIDMEIFEWSWYIAPRFYNAGYCSGDCPFPLDSPVMNSTTHSFIKNLFHYKTDLMNEVVPRACCTPISYYPQTILYFKSDHTSVLKLLPNMKVATCGCR